jgi:hypothetical protein
LNVIAPPGTKQSSILEKINADGVTLEKRFDGFPEIKLSSFSIGEEKVTIFIELTDMGERKSKGERTSQELEKLFIRNMTPLLTQGLSLDTNSQQK